MVIEKSNLTQAILTGVEALESIKNASIDVRSAAVSGRKFLNSLNIIDPIEFNNVEGGESPVTEAPAPTQMAEVEPEELIVIDPSVLGQE